MLRCLNNAIIRPSDFLETPGDTYPVLLLDEGRERFVRELEARLNQVFKHPDSDERVNYRRCFNLQARRIAHCVQTGGAYQPFRVR